jgi:NarL family two-component system response regulator LiaR
MIKVAIVEDNLHYRSAWAKLLENADGFHLNGVYSSAEEALPNLLLRQPDIAMISIQLPVMSGISLIQRVRHKMPGTHFLICTLYQDNDRIFEALIAGAAGYILKNATAEEIKNAVKDLFLGGAHICPYIARNIIALFQKTKGDIDHYGLSYRELEVLRLISKGLLYKEIAEKLFISGNTVKNHLKSIYKKLHVQNKTEAINIFQSRNPIFFSA